MKLFDVVLFVNVLMFVGALAIIVFTLVLALEKMGIAANEICEQQFGECLDAGGEMYAVECNCHNYGIFSDADCKQCYSEAGQWCRYPDGKEIRCEINLSN